MQYFGSFFSFNLFIFQNDGKHVNCKSRMSAHYCKNKLLFAQADKDKECRVQLE